LGLNRWGFRGVTICVAPRKKFLYGENAPFIGHFAEDFSRNDRGFQLGGNSFLPEERTRQSLDGFWKIQKGTEQRRALQQGEGNRLTTIV